MVTETHEDIENGYKQLDDWIKDGITDDAIYVVATRWDKRNPIRNYLLSQLRNTIRNSYDYFGGNNNIKQLNRW